MFRLENNVPEIYVQESRDFQLFCRLYDSVFGGVKFSIDSLQHATLTSQCNDALLDLLRLKVGLFKDLNVSNSELRIILDAFPHIMRYKGSERALKYILNVYQRLIKDNTSSYIYSIINETSDENKEDSYTIYVRFSKEQKYDALLKELIQLILPAGYNLVYEIAQISNPSHALILENNVEIYKVNQSLVLDDYIAPDEFINNDEDANDLTSNVGLTSLSTNNLNDEGDQE